MASEKKSVVKAVKSPWLGKSAGMRVALQTKAEGPHDCVNPHDRGDLDRGNIARLKGDCGVPVEKRGPRNICSTSSEIPYARLLSMLRQLSRGRMCKGDRQEGSQEIAVRKLSAEQ
jgi:hypothetical protein